MAGIANGLKSVGAEAAGARLRPNIGRLTVRYIADIRAFSGRTGRRPPQPKNNWNGLVADGQVMPDLD
jgi:hypothetical protein